MDAFLVVSPYSCNKSAHFCSRFKSLATTEYRRPMRAWNGSERFGDF
jgi:hypothetical protein